MCVCVCVGVYALQRMFLIWVCTCASGVFSAFSEERLFLFCCSLSFTSECPLLNGYCDAAGHLRMTGDVMEIHVSGP